MVMAGLVIRPIAAVCDARYTSSQAMSQDPQSDPANLSRQSLPEPEHVSTPELQSGSPELQPGDFYMDGPYLVFTAQYHLRRGYCCNSGCRHCPYS